MLLNILLLRSLHSNQIQRSQSNWRNDRRTFEWPNV